MHRAARLQFVRFEPLGRRPGRPSGGASWPRSFRRGFQHRLFRERVPLMAETITAAVGTAPAPNRFEDVETIQSLLNQVPATRGGPAPLLDVDGICGPLTIGAIRKFQKHHFGWQDGRVDVNQATLAKLNEFDLDPATVNA